MFCYSLLFRFKTCNEHLLESTAYIILQCSSDTLWPHGEQPRCNFTCRDHVCPAGVTVEPRTAFTVHRQTAEVNQGISATADSIAIFVANINNTSESHVGILDA